MAELEKRGVRPVAISVDTPEESSALRKKTGYTFTFLSDPAAEATSWTECGIDPSGLIESSMRALVV